MTQVRAVAHFLDDLDNGRYDQALLPCFCGVNDDVLIAQRDRYGIPLDTVLCRHCGLMRSDPYFTSESVAYFYREAYRSIYIHPGGISGHFAEQQAVGACIHNYVVQSFPTKPETVLEVGCGAGGILHHFQQHGSRVAGCDFGEDYLQYGMSKGLTLEVGGWDKLAQHGPADLVVLSHLLEHLQNPVAELKNIHGLLKPNALVYVALPGVFSIRDTYGDLALYLQNAHCWHFCLQTLDYVMSMAHFERVRGNENIEALYRFVPGLPPQPTPLGLQRNILASLYRTERLRRYPSARAMLDKGVLTARGALGERAYDLIRKGLRSQVGLSALIT